MSTAAVTYTVPSNSWTGSIDVTDADLLTDITVDDYKIFYDDVEQGSAVLANWTKSSATSLTYSGSSLDQNDVVTIWRNTPNTQVQIANPVTTIQSSLWNNEFDRVVRRAEEAETFYESNNPGSNFVQDTAYSSGWDGVTSQSPSANAVYDMLNSDGNTFAGDSTFSGDLTLSGSNTLSGTTNTVGGTTLDINSTTVDIDCTTFDVDATSCDLSGSTNVLAPTIAKADGGTFTTDVATTAWVNQYLPIDTMNGRITLTTGVPVLLATVSAATTLYYTPYKGNQIWLYNTSDTRWEPYTLTEVSLDVSTTTDDSVADLFIYDNSGTLTLERVYWTDYKTRATDLVLQNGVWCKTGALDRRYIGSVCTKTANQYDFDYDATATDDKTGICGILNYYNRVPYYYRNSNSTSDSLSTGEAILGAGTWVGIMGELKGINNRPYVDYYMQGVQQTTASNFQSRHHFYRGDTAADLGVGYTVANYAPVSITSVLHHNYAAVAQQGTSDELGFLQIGQGVLTGSNTATPIGSNLKINYEY